MSNSILLVNGPNINMLGLRESALYGNDSWASIEHALQQKAELSHCKLLCFQSNHEGQLIDRIQAALHEKINVILINAASLTHTSIGLRDALLAVAIPFIEIHMSNVFAREQFRHQSLLSDIALGVISGFGADSYHLALQAAHSYLLQSIEG